MSPPGGSARAPFSDALLTGLARDGGLYVPKSWPQIAAAAEIAGFAGKSYAAVAERVLSALTDGDIEGKALSAR
jgi:threonine synthase